MDIYRQMLNKTANAAANVKNFSDTYQSDYVDPLKNIYNEYSRIYDEGILSDGSPAAPEEVIGIFTVRGYFIGGSVFAETGPWTTGTVHIVFFDETGWEEGKLVGKNTFTVVGYELSDIDLPYQMAVTGGTGKYRNLGGQAAVINLGMGAYSNQRLRYSIRGNK